MNGPAGFCPFVYEIFNLQITGGTSATTYDPASSVSRLQMAAFLARDFDATARRTGRRGILDQWWTTTPHYDQSLGLTTVGSSPLFIKSDGVDVWVASHGDGTVKRVRASDGKVLDTWTGATGAEGVLVAMGRVFVAGDAQKLYMIDPTAAPGAVTTVTSSLGSSPFGIAFDGNRIWTANLGSVSIVTPGTWAVSSPTAGFSTMTGLVFDGNNMWVTNDTSLLKLDSSGAILQTVVVGSTPSLPVFDGNNIWVPNFSDNTLGVVRASDGTLLKQFSAANGNQNGLSSPEQAAFDGQRVLVTDNSGALSIFKAADLSVIGTVTTPGVTAPFGVCSDGVSFWVTFTGSDSIGRF